MRTKRRVWLAGVGAAFVLASVAQSCGGHDKGEPNPDSNYPVAVKRLVDAAIGEAERTNSDYSQSTQSASDRRNYLNHQAESLRSSSDGIRSLGPPVEIAQESTEFVDALNALAGVIAQGATDAPTPETTVYLGRLEASEQAFNRASDACNRFQDAMSRIGGNANLRCADLLGY